MNIAEITAWILSLSYLNDDFVRSYHGYEFRYLDMKSSSLKRLKTGPVYTGGLNGLLICHKF